MAAGPRGRSWGGCRTGGGGGVWAKRRAVATPPTEVVEEAGWARSAAGVRNRRREGRWRWIWWW
jgi:hypothetical protein